MKNKKKYLLLVLLLLVGVGFTTYALYKTSKSGSANVEAARWVVKVINSNNQSTTIEGNVQNVSLGSCTRLAPGGSCEIPFAIDMRDSEVDSILTLGIGDNVVGATKAQLEAAGIELRIKEGENEAYAFNLNYGTLKNLKLVIKWEAGDEDDDNKSEADVALSQIVSGITIPVEMIVRQATTQLKTVTFNTHDNELVTPSSIQVIDGGTIENIPTLTKTGYVFDGWFTNSIGGTKLTNSTPIVSDIEYHARFHEATLANQISTTGGNNLQQKLDALAGLLSN